MDIRDLFRIGKVSSVDGKTSTVRVTFPDKDDMVSAPLPVIVPCNFGDKEYHLPKEHAQVLCVFLPNDSGRGMNDGYVIGGFYSTEDPPEETDPKVHCLKMEDGSFIRFDGKGNVELHATGNLVLTAAKIELN